MRAEDIFGKQIDEDLASIKKTMTNYAAGAGLMAAAATGGYQALDNYGKNPNDPVQFQIDLEKTANELGYELEVQRDGMETGQSQAARPQVQVDPDTGEKTAQVATHIRDSNQAIKASRKDILILAMTIWGEARSHGKAGMNAVGHVIKNRALAERPKSFGTGIQGVALKRKQFSCWNPGDPNRAKLANMQGLKDQYIKFKSEYDDLHSKASMIRPADLKKMTPQARDEVAAIPARLKQLKSAMLEYQRWTEAKKIAADIVEGRSTDPTGGALYYHTTGVQPVWSKGLKAIKQIANHMFFKRSL